VLAVGIVAHRLPGLDRIRSLVDGYPRVRDLARSLQDGLAVAARPRTVGEAILEGRHQPPWDVAESLRRRSLPGGPEPAQVKAVAKSVGQQAQALAGWARGHS